jgi:hypothetical protein
LVEKANYKCTNRCGKICKKGTKKAQKGTKKAYGLQHNLKLLVDKLFIVLAALD